MQIKGSSMNQRQITLEEGYGDKLPKDPSHQIHSITPQSQDGVAIQELGQLNGAVMGYYQGDVHTPPNLTSLQKQHMGLVRAQNGINQSANTRIFDKDTVVLAQGKGDFDPEGLNRDTLAHSQQIKNLKSLNNNEQFDEQTNKSKIERRQLQRKHGGKSQRIERDSNQQSLICQVAVKTTKVSKNIEGNPLQPIKSSSLQASPEALPNQSMLASMSNIGFPANIHNQNETQPNSVSKSKNHTDDLITTDRIQRVMDTQNNWRVRTKTIDELLHDVKDRIDTNPEYMLQHSEKFLHFFVHLLSDQNFKIVLNTFNILNMIIWMKDQRQRHAKLAKQEISPDQPWGLTNPTLGRHIPLIVKKLADSKNIIRQEGVKCLFGINEIMRSGPKKDNNFIALILPYLNNSSNWHIREELLHLLIKCFLVSRDPSEFDAHQILFSVVQLFKDLKEKIRNLALEAVAGFASISTSQNMVEVLIQLKVEKDVVQQVKQRLDVGMPPKLDMDANLEFPYLEANNQNFDVDSVAHSMTNQTQISQNHSDTHHRRKQSTGSRGVHAGSNPPPLGRGYSSGRKVVVATANASYQKMGESKKDDVLHYAFMESKRTASGHQTNNFDFDCIPYPQNPMSAGENINNISLSAGGTTGLKAYRHQKFIQQFDDVPLQYDLNSSNFLPKLQKFSSNDPFVGERGRAAGSSGVPSAGGYIGMGGDGLDQSQLGWTLGVSPQFLFSGGNKRVNKYIHGTPNQPYSYHSQFSNTNGANLQHQFSRRNSGKVSGIHNLNNSISVKSPSGYDHTHNILDVSAHAGSIKTREYKNQLNDNAKYANNPTNAVSGQILSDKGQSDTMSYHFMSNANGTTTMKNYRQTPSSFNQDQMLFSEKNNQNNPDMSLLNLDGMPDLDSSHFDDKMNHSQPGQLKNQNERMQIRPDFEPGSSVRQSGYKMEAQIGENHTYYADESKQGPLSPNNRDKQSLINVVDGNESGLLDQYQPRINKYRQNQDRDSQRSHQRKKIQKQNTFYSDGTTVTGITAVTRDTAQNKAALHQNGNGSVIKGGASGPPLHPQIGFQKFKDSQQQASGNQGFRVRQGPIKATREALGNQNTSKESHSKQEDSSTGENKREKFSINNIQRRSNPATEQDKNMSRTSNYSDNKFDNESYKDGNYPNNSQSAFDVSSKDSQEFRRDDDPALITQSSKVTFIRSEDLDPLSSPDKDFKKSISKNQGLFSKEWFDQFEACNTVRKVCRHHQSVILQNGNQLNQLVAVLLKLAESLRSAVVRISLMTLTDLFITLKRVMEPCLDVILKILLKKGCDTNNFISEEADKCMTALVQNCQESKVFQVLFQQNFLNKSNQIRLKICQCLLNIVKSLGNNILFFKENDKLLVQLAKYLQDASQDVRQTAKFAFVELNQSIMGENELERLLQRVLNEVQYKKVKEFLDKTPNLLSHCQGSQIDFVITNASSQGPNSLNKRTSSKHNQQSFKNLRHSLQKQANQSQTADYEQDSRQLNIQAKSILNPKRRDSNQKGIIKIKTQPQKQASQSSEQSLSHSQLKLESIQDVLNKTQQSDWRQRLEAQEALFTCINSQSSGQANHDQAIADAICRLVCDQNAKIQVQSLDNLSKGLQAIQPFVTQNLSMFYKALGSNLASSNLGVKKISDYVLKKINDSIQDKSQVLQSLSSLVTTGSSNPRAKPLLIDQVQEVLEGQEELSSGSQRILCNLAVKLLDENKNEIKWRCERLVRKAYQMMGQPFIESIPPSKAQRISEIINAGGMAQKNLVMTGTNNSSGKGSSVMGTGSFGTSGSKI